MTAQELKNEKANKKAAEQRASFVKYIKDAYAKDKLKREAKKKKDAEKKVKKNSKVLPVKKPKAKRATDKGGREGAPGSKDFKPQTKPNTRPDMSTVNKPDADNGRRVIDSKGRLRFPNLEERKENYDRRTKVINRNVTERLQKKQSEKTRAPGSKDFKPQTKPNTRPDMSTVNKPDTPPKKKSTVNKPDTPPKKKSMLDRAKNTTGINRPATAKEQRGRDQQKNARKSMGMKKGGMVKKCRMDGIALRGKTRAKERSK